jgi:glycosyltransferase involved in cell wall biosynthesis
MEVIYSINARLGGGGIGNTAYYAVSGPERTGELKRVICSSNARSELPRRRVRALGVAGQIIKRLAFADKSGRLNDWANRIFDRWSSIVLERCDVLHCWSDLSQTLARGKRLGAVTVVECMMHLAALRSILLREAAKWELRPADLPSSAGFKRYLDEIQAADHITVPSEFNAKTHLEHGVPKDKLHIVPYGVDTRRFHPDETSPPHPFRVLFVGHFSLRKGAPYVLEAWQKLKWHDAELWIVGNIDSEISRLIRQRWSGLSGVQYRGFHPNVPDLYRRSDVFLFPSLGEGSALVVYEAMASGLPVIVTHNAGSLAQHTIDGEYVEPGDSEAIVHALERMRADPARRREMGRQARQRIEPYTWQSYGDRLMEAYKRLL